MLNKVLKWHSSDLASLVSHQNSKSTRGRLASIPSASPSSCGWPGRASPPLCLPSGSLGEWDRGCWGEEPRKHTWSGVLFGTECQRQSCFLWRLWCYSLFSVFRVFLWLECRMLWGIVSEALEGHAVPAASAMDQGVFGGYVVVLGTNQGWRSALDTSRWSCIATMFCSDDLSAASCLNNILQHTSNRNIRYMLYFINSTKGVKGLCWFMKPFLRYSLFHYWAKCSTISALCVVDW